MVKKFQEIYDDFYHLNQDYLQYKKTLEALLSGKTVDAPSYARLAKKIKVIASKYADYAGALENIRPAEELQNIEPAKSATAAP